MFLICPQEIMLHDYVYPSLYTCLCIYTHTCNNQINKQNNVVPKYPDSFLSPTPCSLPSHSTGERSSYIGSLVSTKQSHFNIQTQMPYHDTLKFLEAWHSAFLMTRSSHSKQAHYWGYYDCGMLLCLKLFPYIGICCIYGEILFFQILCLQALEVLFSRRRSVEGSLFALLWLESGPRFLDSVITKLDVPLVPSLISFHQSHLLMRQMTSLMCPRKMTLKSPEVHHLCG